MSAIYEQSIVNISALRANDSLDGLLYNSEAKSVFLKLADTEIVGIRPSLLDLRSAIFESAMGSCGWVLQGRILSPAILHYSQNQVHWECCGGLASQDEPDIEMNSLGVLKDTISDRSGCVLHAEGHLSA